MNYTIAILGLLFSMNTFAQQTKDTSYRAGYVYGNNFVYLLNAPKGWVFDNKSGITQQIPAMFYPKGQNVETAPVIMYSNFVTTGKRQQFKQLASVIQYDSMQHKKISPACIVKKDNDIVISKGQNTVAQIMFFKNSGAATNVESTAYISFENKVVVITMSAPNVSVYEENKELFYDLVKSFLVVKANNIKTANVKSK